MTRREVSENRRDRQTQCRVVVFPTPACSCSPFAGDSSAARTVGGLLTLGQSFTITLVEAAGAFWRTQPTFNVPLDVMTLPPAAIFAVWPAKSESGGFFAMLKMPSQLTSTGEPARASN